MSTIVKQPGAAAAAAAGGGGGGGGGGGDAVATAIYNHHTKLRLFRDQTKSPKIAMMVIPSTTATTMSHLCDAVALD